MWRTALESQYYFCILEFERISGAEPANVRSELPNVQLYHVTASMIWIHGRILLHWCPSFVGEDRTTLDRASAPVCSTVYQCLMIIPEALLKIRTSIQESPYLAAQLEDLYHQCGHHFGTMFGSAQNHLRIMLRRFFSSSQETSRFFSSSQETKVDQFSITFWT